MTTIALTLELAQNLDIQVSQMTGMLQDPKYAQLLQSYDLDASQCLLWWEISQILSGILENFDYEDVEIPLPKFGLEVKKILAQDPKKYSYVTMLLNQYGILHQNHSIGQVIWETIEDIDSIYQSISNELQKILTSQKDIQKIVKRRQEE